MLKLLPALGTLAFTFAFAAPAVAQEAESELPPVTYPDIAKTAPDASGFVPKGWMLEFKAAGDLDKDGKPDLALVLRGQDKKNILKDYFGAESFDSNPRMLVVGLAKEGGYELALANHTLIPRPDNPSQEDPLSESGGISIDRGGLVAAFYFFMSAGGTDSGTWSYRFRLEDRRFRLIGFDAYNMNRMSGESEEVSINYLTGKVIVKTGSMESDATTDRVKRLKSKKPVYLEDVGDGMMYQPQY